MKIAIVGCGPAGIISAISTGTALQRRNRRIGIDIFESGEAFRGRSFNTSSTNMLLNTSIGVSSINSADPAEFLRYLIEQEGMSVGDGDVVPRDAARRYLQTEYGKAGNRDIEFQIVAAHVDDISLDSQGSPCLHSRMGWRTYDAVVLATGLHFRQLPLSFTGAEVISPYPAEQLAQVDRDDLVLVVGTRLSAVDALVCLAANGHHGQIHVHSRSRLFPAVRKAVIKPGHQRPLKPLPPCKRRRGNRTGVVMNPTELHHPTSTADRTATGRWGRRPMVNLVETLSSSVKDSI